MKVTIGLDNQNLIHPILQVSPQILRQVTKAALGFYFSAWKGLMEPARPFVTENEMSLASFLNLCISNVSPEHFRVATLSLMPEIDTSGASTQIIKAL